MFTGSIEHVTERVENIMGRGTGGTILVHIGTNNADKEGRQLLDKYRKLMKKTKEARVEQIILSGILPVFGNKIDGSEFEADGDQRDGEAALQGGGRGIRGSVGQLCGERGTVCTLVGRGLPFLPRDSQGRLPVAWVKYDI